MPEHQKKWNAVSWDTLREIALALPGAEENTSGRTPTIKVGGKMFVRLREEGEVIVVCIELNDRATRIAADPDAFFVTEHYGLFPYMLVRLSAVAKDDLAELLTDAWRRMSR
jgi:hypothetical protein